MEFRSDGSGVCIPTPWTQVVVLVVILMAVIVLVRFGYEATIALGIIAATVPVVQGICHLRGDQPDAR
ncbi:hypothetical protein GCM10022226_62610 [Sphaerisporangium flaviroseum]|uniref:Uncharacterized protein n=1 Tax=Sphaerisporangium flaviroseum TaxID=509199 RepID=A0ABP7J390_9ACTN